MPANLTPQYRKAEEQYRRAQTAEERLESLQQMLALIPKHKGTDKLQADLKARLKETREELRSERKAGRKGRRWRFPRQGAGQVILIGAPNSGKSRILAELTNAEPAVAPYPFTTHEPFPAMMPWQDVQVQLIDTPPITESHIEPYITSLVRAADLALLCFDASSDDAPEQTAAVVQQLADRKTVLSDRTGMDEDDFSLVHVKTFLVATRGDDPDAELRLELFREAVPRAFPTIRVELDRPESREALRDAIYQHLDVIRVYTKPPGRKADTTAPFTIPREGTVAELALEVHRDLAENLKYARVWGSSARDGQIVGRDHRLCDGDIVELHA